MRSTNAGRGRGRWLRPLVLLAVVAIAPACGGDSQSSQDRPVPTTGSQAGTQPAQPAQPVMPGATAVAGGGPVAAAPAPGLDPSAPPPQLPPSTVSLDELYRQGKVHVQR